LTEKVNVKDHSKKSSSYSYRTGKSFFSRQLVSTFRGSHFYSKDR